MTEEIQTANNLTKKQRRALRQEQKAAERSSAERRYRWRRLAIWLGVVVGFGLMVWGLVWLAGNDPTPVLVIDGTVDAQDHVRGNPQAPVTVIEYSDFQCPACRYYEPLLTQLVTDFGDQVAVVYRHFPLTTIHANAQAAAQAAEAAGRQNKFWEMHDLLFERQSEWSADRRAAETFEQYATELGLNLDQFKTDYNSTDVRDVISRQVASGLAADLPGTPSIFINGQLIDNPRDYATLQALVQQTLAGGTPVVDR